MTLNPVLLSLLQDSLACNSTKNIFEMTSRCLIDRAHHLNFNVLGLGLAELALRLQLRRTRGCREAGAGACALRSGPVCREVTTVEK